jgi:uncharacterized protein (DUF433 family)
MANMSTDIATTPTTTPAPLTIADHIVITPGTCGGKPRIAGHRIKVQHIAIWHERMGMSPQQIVADYPGITLADIYAALAYYYDHREEIEKDIAEGERLFEELKKSQPSIVEKAKQKLAEGNAKNSSGS